MSTYVVATDFGGPEVLSFVERELPAPGPGEVTVAVRAAGVNPADYKRYAGFFGTDRAQLPMPLGFEASGEVTAVGADADGPAGPVSVGDHVILFRVSGAYADQVVVPAASVVPKPASLSWEQAGGLMLAGATATHAVAVTGIGEGDVLLVHGGAGGVGVATIQIAADRGARVIATASERNHTFLRELGAEPVTYGPGLADRARELAPGGVDAAADLIGTDEAVDVSVELVADRDRIVTIAAFDRTGDAGIRAIGNGPGADPGTELRDAARLELVERVERGTLHVVVDRSFPLAEVAAAHELSRAGHVRGKLVLVP